MTEAPAYVYGVAPSDALPELDLSGVSGAPVTTVVDGDLAALVSVLPAGDLRVRRRDLVSHLEVLESAFAGSTIVPCAFGMLLPSEDAVRSEFLRPREAELLRLLDRLDGFAQMNVRASYDEDVVLAEIVVADPEIARLRARLRELGGGGYRERLRLGELVAAALAARRERDGRALVDRLAGIVEEFALDEPQEDGVLKASFLVGRRSIDAFERELDKIAREQAPRLMIESIGPLPPTAFASLDGAGGDEGRWGS